MNETRKMKSDTRRKNARQVHHPASLMLVNELFWMTERKSDIHLRAVLKS
jgi:hypothetical protein